MIQNQEEAVGIVNNDNNLPDSPRFGVPLITIITFTFIICVLPVTFTPSGSFAGTLFTCVISGAVFSFLYMTTGYKWLFFLPVIPYLIALLITRDPLMSVEALSFYPASIAFVTTCKKKFSYTSTLITVSTSLIVFYACYLMISISAHYGALNTETLTTFWNDTVQPLRDTYAQITTIVDGEEVKVYSQDQINYVVSSMLLYIPATAVCVTNIVAFIIMSLYSGLAHVFRIKRYITPRRHWKLELSVISAYIYCAVYLVIIFSGGSIIGTVTAVTANLLVILTPGFSFLGLRSLIYRFRSGEGRKITVIVLILTAVFMVISPSMVFYIMSLTGVIETIVGQNKFK
jgi:Predicted membrane protein (DUF2232).